jgi:hypothetical protein
VSEGKRKNLQFQIGFSVRNIEVDLIVDNEGFHFYVDKLLEIEK